jgi:hypothetical protein
MSQRTSASADQPTPPTIKPAWRFARERRLGRIARQLLGTAEAEIPSAVAVLGRDVVLDATRQQRWALACLERAAACDEGSREERAWVLLAACRPTLVRRAVHRAPRRTRRYVRAA